jgi:hypothetical protein
VCVLPLLGKNFLPIYHLICNVYNQALQIGESINLFDAAVPWVEIFTYLSTEVRFLPHNASASKVCMPVATFWEEFSACLIPFEMRNGPPSSSDC